MCQPLNVIIESENGARKQKCLPNVKEKSRGYICHLEDLIRYHHYGCNYQQDGTCIL